MPDGSVTADDIASLPAGSVIQVVSNTYETQVTNSTTTFADTGLSASITPSSASSKILVIVSQNGCGMSPSGGGIEINLDRSGVNLGSFSRIAGYASNYVFFGSVSGSILDEPNTTSTVAYKTQFRLFLASGVAYLQESNSGIAAVSTITLMEIAA